MHVLRCRCNTKRKSFLTSLKRKLQDINEHEMQSFNVLTHIESLLRSENEQDAEHKMIFLGWIERSWLKSDGKSSKTWFKHVIKECLQFMVDSWDERNLHVNEDSAKVKNLKKRFKEHNENREKLGQSSLELLDKILETMDKCSKEQLETKMEIFRREMKKEKQNKGKIKERDKE